MFLDTDPYRRVLAMIAIASILRVNNTIKIMLNLI